MPFRDWKKITLGAEAGKSLGLRKRVMEVFRGFKSNLIQNLLFAELQDTYL